MSTIFQRRTNKILMLKDDVGNTITAPVEIKNHIREYYRSLFSSESSTCPPNSISLETFNCSQMPTMNELEETIFSIKGSKAPGDDGYHAFFYHHFWDSVQSDCFNLIKDVFKFLNVPNELNSTLITLIPKINNPLRINNFRPISLVNINYKMITKILVQRIRPQLEKLISPNQNSFIPNRGSDINFIVASEILHSMNKKKGKIGLLALKLDLEKAYDRLEWTFIEHCLKNMNFSYDSIKLIMSCVASGDISIQINGSRTAPFKPSRGIRQGDPLSPYIFIICLEYLSMKIHEACNEKSWVPFKVRGGGKRKFHTYYSQMISSSLGRLTPPLSVP